jgi:hypothetical protein
MLIRLVCRASWIGRAPVENRSHPSAATGHAVGIFPARKSFEDAESPAGLSLTMSPSTGYAFPAFPAQVGRIQYPQMSCQFCGNTVWCST